MEVEYEMTVDDLAAFQRYHAAQGGNRGLWLRMLLGLFVVGGLALGLAIFLADDKKKLVQQLIVIAICSVILVPALALFFHYLPRIAPKALVRDYLRQGDNARVLEKVRVALTPGG